MILEVLTPEKSVFTGEVDAVNVPGKSGAFEVLNKHAAIISTLQKGKVIIRQGGKNTEIMIESGMIEVLDNKVTVLAESIIETED
ncbi:MAG: F-type H+-transporting ATPase subunit epsilon [Sphingobacteriales bacterium]|jgi:F-type H+-transporting ATPase subunit epsilon